MVGFIVSSCVDGGEEKETEGEYIGTTQRKSHQLGFLLCLWAFGWEIRPI